MEIISLWFSLLQKYIGAGSVYPKINLRVQTKQSPPPPPIMIVSTVFCLWKQDSKITSILDICKDINLINLPKVYHLLNINCLQPDYRILSFMKFSLREIVTDFRWQVISLHEIFTDWALFFVYFYYKINFHCMTFSLIGYNSENIENHQYMKYCTVLHV